MTPLLRRSAKSRASLACSTERMTCKCQCSHLTEVGWSSSRRMEDGGSVFVAKSVATEPARSPMARTTGPEVWWRDTPRRCSSTGTSMCNILSHRRRGTRSWPEQLDIVSSLQAHPSPLTFLGGLYPRLTSHSRVGRIRAEQRKRFGIPQWELDNKEDRRMDITPGRADESLFEADGQTLVRPLFS